MLEKYENCTLCARRCGVNRAAGELGFCKSFVEPKIARAALHMWEEPIISGERGSGTVFFSGCSLGCVFCQNRAISDGDHGKAVSTERLARIMWELKEKGAHNINFVTPTHYAPSVAMSVDIARAQGFDLPIVYNTGSYETPETVRMLDGRIDVYLPDLKYYRKETANKYSNAEDYVETARAAIAEMVRQTGEPRITEDGILKRGTVVRVLLLPGHVAEAKLTVRYLYDTYGDGIYISLMNQYTPMPGMERPLDRTVTREEYDELCDYAARLGVTRGFTQEWGTAKESFIPPFDFTGVE